VVQAIETRPLSRREQNRIEKRQRALDAALTIFSKKGYPAATMDTIAAEAGLTKPTLYQYFQGKDELFREMMLAPRKEMMMAFDPSTRDCHITQLWEFSWLYAKVVMKPEFLALARLVIGGAQQDPELGKAYQASGPDHVLTGLAAFMARQSKLGKLEIEDAELAAEDFWGLILSAPRNRALHVPDAYKHMDQLEKYINNGIRVFIKAYSSQVKADLTRLDTLIKTRPQKNR